MFFDFKIASYPLIILTIISGFILGNKITIETKNISTEKETKTIDSIQKKRRAPEFNYRISKTNLKLTKVFESGENGRELSRIITQLLNGDTPQNWEDELSKIMECTRESGGRLEALLVLFSKWAEVDFQSAFERSGKLPLYCYTLRSEIFSQIAERDPQSAYSAYKKNEEVSFIYASTVLGDIAENWAILNSEKAFEWCHTSGGRFKIHNLTRFMKGLNWEPDKTTAYMEKIRNNSGKIHPALIKEWLKADPETAKKWITTNENI